MSQKTGVAPVMLIQDELDIQLKSVTNTSAPGPIP